MDTVKDAIRNPQFHGLPRGQRGTALVLSLFLITVLTVLGTMVLNTSIVEIKMAQNQKISAQVFYAAEAGLERGLLLLIDDFETEGGTAWGNSTYPGWTETVTETAVTGGTTFDPDIRSLDMYTSSSGGNLKELTLSGGHTVNNLTFDLYLYRVDTSEVYVMSHAYGNGGMAAIEYHLAMDDLSAYNNAIFTGAGIAGNFQGSVNVAGSIYSKGNLDLGSNVHINNNYDDDRAGKAWADNPTLSSIIDYVGDLDTKIRVNGGDLTVGSASTQVGYAGSNNSIAGIYVDGATNIDTVGTHYYDEHTNEVPSVPLPSIFDGLREVFDNAGEDLDACILTKSGANDAAIATSIYADWAEGLGCMSSHTGTGAVFDGDIELDQNTPSGWLAGPDVNGNGIYFTQKPGLVTDPGMGEITVQGTVVITGDFIFGDNKLEGLNYNASGPDTGLGSDPADGATLYVGGNFTATGEFYPDTGYLKGTDFTPPPGTNDVNSLGVVTPNDVTFEGSNSDTHVGFFFAEGQVNFNKQSKFAGTVIAGLVNYAQVPDIYQVPNLKDYLPPGVPGGQNVIMLTSREWRRVY